MTSILHRFLSSGILAVWGTVLCTFYFTGRISAYLHPTFQPFALAAGCALVVLAFLVLIAPDLEASHCPSPERPPVRGVLMALVLVGPLLVAFSNSQDSFGASAVSNRTYVQDIAQLPAAQPPATVEPALPDDGSSAEAGDNKAADPYSFPKNKKGDIQAQVVDFLYAAQLPEMRTELENKQIEVIGQLMPAKTNNPQGSRYDVIRMFMTCCAADAQPVALPVEPRDKPGLREMTWVKVSGKATFPVIGGQRMPLIENGVIEKTDPPEDTYLY
ncbi:MAG: TIGR03943 family protein [Terrimicrobiaceae bacterium]|nr:TIGR03943 family protein [Terrimicrobiaceae bacterium]